VKTTRTVLLVAGLLVGTLVASSETFAAGPMLMPEALSSAANATAFVEPAVVVVRRGPVVVRRGPVVRRPAVVVRRPVVVAPRRRAVIVR
jgi:hypothetical protein